LIVHPGESFGSCCRKLEFLGFFQIGTAPALNLASAEQPAERNNWKEITMTHQNSITGRLAAAASAFFISLVLITGTVSTPSTAQAQTYFVGEVA